MDKFKSFYEWSVVVLAIMVAALTAAAIWLQFLDGQVVNIPVKFNAPHSFKHPIGDHQDRPASSITHLMEKSTYHLGEAASAYVDIEKFTDKPGMVQWQLMDARFYPYVARRGVIQRGHHHLLVNIEKIPMHIPPGQYYFSGSITYEINFTKDVVIPIRTNCFQVVE